jgi:hypothetical protein
MMKKMKLLGLIGLLGLVAGCSKSLDIITPHEPVLQIDAVFFSGETLPEIKIKKTFNASGNDLFEIPAKEVFVSGANVTLKWNGANIAVKEISAGSYEADTKDTVKRGDRFEITVTKDNKKASAVAEVPNYPQAGIQAQSQGMVAVSKATLFSKTSREDSVIGWYGEAQVQLKIPFVADYTAVQLLSTLGEGYNLYWYFSSMNTEFKPYLGDDYIGFDSLTATRKVFVFIEGDAPASGIHKINCQYSIIVPEPIYAIYFNTSSSVLVPTTITNVEGGVGLFIGAIREEGEIDVSVLVEAQK